MLPQNVPDEGSHIMKAYDISIGHIFTQIDENGNSYSTITKAIEDFSYMHFRKYNDVNEELNTITNYEEEVRVICAAQGYSSILYIGPAIAFSICRAVGVNYVYAIYLGRCFNIIIFLILGFLSIKKIPFGKLLLAIYLCLPMMLQQAASCSGDAILNSVLIYYISHLIYLVFKEEAINKKEQIILYVCTALVAMFKYIYILVAGILLIKLFNKKDERKQNIKIISIMILIGSIFAIGWFVFTSQYKSIPPAFEKYNEISNVNSSNQIEYIKTNPVMFLKTFVNEYLIHGSEYIFGAIGSKLGWLEVEIDFGIISAFIIILILAAISEKSKYEFSVKQKVWIFTIIFVISVILNIIMYVTFTPV